MAELSPQAASPESASRVPPMRAMRDRLACAADDYAASAKLTVPVALDELRAHAAAVVRLAGAGEQYLDYAVVLLNNALWRSTLAAIPFNRRLLLLPQCLRGPNCPGTIDELGLLCKGCGSCLIDKLSSAARALGYVVLVAEGSTVVTSLIATGRVSAVVGVSCMSVLERVFPYMQSAAVPGVAVPLLGDGCQRTEVDVDLAWEAIHLSSDPQAGVLDLDLLRVEVEGWFAPERLAVELGGAGGKTEQIAQEWLARSGKRWRPVMTAAAYAAFAHAASPLPESLVRLALAVECFHKASLVHDDIEDGDLLRYGQPALHQQYGLAVALNVGDLLLGEGYRLIGRCGAEAAAVASMLNVAADGHRRLCLGQGEELYWRRSPRPLSSSAVLEIFRHKTAPAFDVALLLGAILAKAPAEQLDRLREFGEPLGVAYQIRDDLQDFIDGPDGADADAPRPSLLLALAYERATGAARQLLERVWSGQRDSGARVRLAEVLAELGVVEQARSLLEQRKEQALLAVDRLAEPALKMLLRRVVARIFHAEGSAGGKLCQPDATTPGCRDTGESAAEAAAG